jgi:hypothetical protein
MGKVTADVLRGTICVYFMIGFAFAIIYTLIELFHPILSMGSSTVLHNFPMEITTRRWSTLVSLRLSL